MLDLNDMQLFSAVVAHGGFSAAARALGMSKSHVSKRVVQLEQRLGTRLLERSTRAVRVTDVGQAFYARCEAVLAEIAAAEAVVAESLTAPTGKVRLSCPPALARTLLAQALPSFAARYPLVDVIVNVVNRPVDLIEERVDIAIRARSRLDGDPDFMMRVLARGASCLVASPGFLAREGPITLSKLASLPALSLTETRDTVAITLLGPDAKSIVVRMRARISCNDFDVIASTARAGMGIALLPLHICDASLRDGTLERVMPDYAGPEVTVHLVFTTTRGLRPSVRALIDHLVESWSVASDYGSAAIAGFYKTRHASAL